MTLIASIPELPPHGKIVKVVGSEAFSGGVSKSLERVWIHSPLLLPLEILARCARRIDTTPERMRCLPGRRVRLPGAGLEGLGEATIGFRGEKDVRWQEVCIHATVARPVGAPQPSTGTRKKNRREQTSVERILRSQKGPQPDLRRQLLVDSSYHVGNAWHRGDHFDGDEVSRRVYSRISASSTCKPNLGQS
jgi:hypothetical protein